MGLVKQIDDHLGRLFAFLRERGIDRETLIVFTSDHGDYLGDHGLGEKELFHDAIVRVPMIVVDPRAEADATRGQAIDRLVESIDLVPTFLDALGLPGAPEWLEGASWQPLLHGRAPPAWRELVFSENSYAFRDEVRLPLGRPVDGCLMTMVRGTRWKYIHYEGVRPQLFDLENDPDEYADLGTDPSHAAVREQMAMRLFDWLRRRKRFSTISLDDIEQWNRREVKAGIQIGVW
jgi:arylsulfatase A-like enzyme